MIIQQRADTKTELVLSNEKNEHQTIHFVNPKFFRDLKTTIRVLVREMRNVHTVEVIQTTPIRPR